MTVSPMIAEELINPLVPPLKPTDRSGLALDWMDEFRCNHLPVVSDGKFLGFVTYEVLVDGDSRDRLLGDLILSGETCKVPADAHFYEIMKTAADHRLQQVVVVNDLGLYEGVILSADVMTMFAQTASFQMPGSILVLSMELIHYSLAEIARLVEENTCRILSSALLDDPLDKARIRLILKTDQTDLSRVVATLERFGHRVVGRYEGGRYGDADRERYDMLMRYLNI